MNRNNYIYTWQVNRNPFIDYPNLADYIWGENAGQAWYSTLSNNSVSNKSIAIYPNPISDYVVFSGITDSTLVEIYTVSGSKIYQTTITTDSKIKLNLASGIYLAKLSSETNTTLKKIIVK
jgi:hypothetical protein